MPSHHPRSNLRATPVEIQPFDSIISLFAGSMRRAGASVTLPSCSRVIRDKSEPPPPSPRHPSTNPTLLLKSLPCGACPLLPPPPHPPPALLTPSSCTKPWRMHAVSWTALKRSAWLQTLLWRLTPLPSLGGSWTRFPSIRASVGPRRRAQRGKGSTIIPLGSQNGQQTMPLPSTSSTPLIRRPCTEEEAIRSTAW